MGFFGSCRSEVWSAARVLSGFSLLSWELCNFAADVRVCAIFNGNSVSREEGGFVHHEKALAREYGLLWASACERCGSKGVKRPEAPAMIHCRHGLVNVVGFGVRSVTGIGRNSACRFEGQRRTATM